MKQKSWPVKTTLFLAMALFLSLAAVAADDAKPKDPAAARNLKLPIVLNSPFRAVDLSLGETTSVKLADGRSVEVKLLDLHETRDRLRHAVRKAQVTVEINGQKLVLPSAGYHLPTAVGGVQVDCPITKGLVQRGSNPWALDKDARLRLWPAGAPWIQAGTFRYPLRQRWFASDTQMANEPTFVNGDEAPGKTNVYYHWGLDAGGAEGLTEVVAATDGVVVSSGEARLASEKLPEPVQPRYDAVYLRDGRGWYYRYSHLHTIDDTMKPGANVRLGQRVGLLGKEGGSGGWSHLHFDVVALQSSGRHGMVEPYAFYWQAYHSERPTKLQAVARPHHLVATGETVTIDGKILTWLSLREADGDRTVLSRGRSGMFLRTLLPANAENMFCLEGFSRER